MAKPPNPPPRASGPTNFFVSKNKNAFQQQTKKLENFGGHLLSEDDPSYWAPPYWNITKKTFSLGRTEL